MEQTDNTQQLPTARLIGALVCEDAMVSKDDRVAIWGEYNIVTVAALPHSRSLSVFSKWFVLQPIETRFLARVFSPSGEMLTEQAADWTFVQGGVIHTQVFPFGSTEFSEAGAHNVVLMRDDRMVLEIPVFVLLAPDLAAEEVDQP